MDFARRSRAANSAVLDPIWPNFELVRDVIDVLVTCKYEEDPIKIKALEWSDIYCFINPYRKDRNMHGGGLLMYINSNLVHRRRQDLEIFCAESIWAEIKVKQDIYLIGLFYSPSTADSVFF